MRELIHVTHEVTISDGVVQRAQVLVGVVSVQPVAVLEGDGLHAERVDHLWVLLVVIEQQPHARHVLLVVHRAAVELNEVGELVDEEIGALVEVTPHEHRTLLEGAPLQRHVGRLDEEGSVYYGQEGELHDAPRHPLLADQAVGWHAA